MIPKPINFSKQNLRANEIGKKLLNSKYDVLLFQEAFSRSARKLIYKKLSKTYPYQYYSKTRKGGKFFGVLPSGVWIVSKFPIKNVKTKLFDDCTTSDCLADKAVHLYELEINDSKKMQIANTHMQAWNTEKSINVRIKQLKQIKNLLDKYKQIGVPQILAGDLNIDFYKREEYLNMLQILDTQSIALTGDIQISNGFAVDCFKIPASEIGGEWLDHLFIFPNLSTATVQNSKLVSFRGLLNNKECDLSDHYGIEAVIEL